MMGYLVYRTAQWIVMTFSKWFTYRLAVIIADVFYMFQRNERKALFENLRHAFPEKGDKTIRLYARLTFHNFGKYLVDFFRFDKFDRIAMEKEVTIVGKENVDECLRKGRGLITVTAHLGSWELGGVVMALLGYKFNVVALSHGSAKVDTLFVRQRENKGVKVIPLGTAVARCLGALRRNELIALLGDRNINETGIRVKFFDKEVSLPKGPAVLSLHNNTPILPGFLVRTKEDKFCLILDRPLPDVKEGTMEERLRKLTRELVNVIERYIRQYPGQWFMFYPIWGSAI